MKRELEALEWGGAPSGFTTEDDDARDALLDAVGRGRAVVVNLAGVGYIDSSGVASLVESFQAARKSFSLDFAAAKSLSAFSNLSNELS